MIKKEITRVMSFHFSNGHRSNYRFELSISGDKKHSDWLKQSKQNIGFLLLVSLWLERVHIRYNKPLIQQQINFYL